MCSSRTLPLPRRAGSLAPQGSGTTSCLLDADGRPVEVPAERLTLWQLLDGRLDAAALARALGWPAEQVWSELDALADHGLLEHRAAPPAGGAGLSRRRVLRGSVPALAMTVPGYALAAAAEDSTKDGQEQQQKGEESSKNAAAEQSSKAAAQQEQQTKLGEMASKQNAEQDGKQQESSQKLGEAAQKSGQQQEQADKVNAEIAIKAGQGDPNNAVPEPSSLALVGAAGVAAYLRHRLLSRSGDEPVSTDRPEGSAGTPSQSGPT